MSSLGVSKMAHRASYNHLHPVSQRSLLPLRSIIGRSRSHRVLQVRQLWWWGRHANNTQWSSSFDEHMEERLRRQQRIIKHQYSKMLRRREMWDRDRGSRLSWPWKLSHRWLGTRLTDSQTISSTNASRSKVEEQRDEDSAGESRLATFHKDFESFKKAVDQAIERDPYGTLFGRRLQSPPTNNNSSWTSFSWIFDPKEIKEEKVETVSGAPDQTPEIGASPPRGPTHDQSRPAKGSPVPATQSLAAEEYEYDPISMRRVLKARVEYPRPISPPPSQSPQQLPQSSQPPEPSKTVTSANVLKSQSLSSSSKQPSNASKSTAEPVQPKTQSLFQALFFSEHGVDIPVKTYKPHKVYGPRAVSQQEKTESEAFKKKVGFETNRKLDLKALKAASLGNTIDTTAEYGGKYSTVEEIAPKDPPRTPRDQSIPSDDTPLFSGTTYESRSSEILKSAQPMSDWLRKEGFTIEQALSGKNADAVDIPVKKFGPPRSETKANVRSGKLEPALDRQKQPTRGETSSERGSVMRDRVAEKFDDIDFLRASDIRAATRSGRKSKLEMEQDKTETRKKLEDDFSARQKQSETSAGFTRPDTRSVVSKSLDNVWKHVQKYPDGIVARTVKSMGIFNNSFKKYVRPEPKVDLSQKLDFKDESLNKVSSIYKSRRKTPQSISFLPSKEVLEADRVNLKRIRDLREATLATERSSHAETAKANDLAKDLKREYEDTYGPISVHHRQLTSKEPDGVDGALEQTHTKKFHPLSDATVKPGIPRYPDIESYVSKFEPKFAKLVGEAKAVRRELHEAQIHYRSLKERMKMLPWSEIEIAQPTEVIPSATVKIDESSSRQCLDEPSTPKAQTSKSDTENAPALTMEEPVFTPNESAVWNDEQPPPISELKEAYTAPFVVLKYNSETDTVARLNVHFHEAGQGQPLPPLKILSQLRRTEKFFPFFEQLEKQKYEIISSESDTLIFRKIRDPAILKREQEEARNTEAAQEASAQPVVQEAPEVQPESLKNTPPQKEAATVLDEIPIEIEPSPGPSAPTAPPATPTSKPVQSPTVPKPKVKRQENVFSGTRRTLPPTTNPIDPEIASPRPAPLSYQEQDDEPTARSSFSRFLRTTKRIFLTVLGLSVGAYVVGVITEGINAKAQQKQITDGGAGLEGPRKKIVLSGTRPGIFSTENSR